MSFFTATVTSAGTSYPASADTTIPFEARRVSLRNTESYAGDSVFVRFGTVPSSMLSGDGNDEVEVRANQSFVIERFRIGELKDFGKVECEVRVRSDAGTPSVVINAVS